MTTASGQSKSNSNNDSKMYRSDTKYDNNNSNNRKLYNSNKTRIGFEL